MDDLYKKLQEEQLFQSGMSLLSDEEKATATAYCQGYLSELSELINLVSQSLAASEQVALVINDSATSGSNG